MAMTRPGAFLARFVGTEKVGDLTLNQVGILFYLYFNPREARFSSPEKLGNELDMAEQTVVPGFSALKRCGYVAASEFPKEYSTSDRDPRQFVVTPLGRKALRPFLRYFGFSDLVMTSLLVFCLGALCGTIYIVQQAYAPYFWIWLAVTVPLLVALILMTIRLTAIGRDSHRRQLFLALKKHE
jgi:DNA-binding MarR family transcriptional regulator